MSLFKKIKGKSNNRTIKNGTFDNATKSSPEQPTNGGSQSPQASSPLAEVKDPKTLLPFDKPSPWMLQGGISSKTYNQIDRRPSIDARVSDVDTESFSPSSPSRTEDSEMDLRSETSTVNTDPSALLPFKTKSSWMTGGIGKYSNNNLNSSPSRTPNSVLSPTPSEEIPNLNITAISASPADSISSPPNSARSTTSQAALKPETKPQSKGPIPSSRSNSKSSMKGKPRKNSKVNKSKRIVILGCRDVGKTALTFRFFHNEFFYYDELRMKRSTSESDLKRISSLDELTEKKKYTLETDANEMKEQKELQESFGVKSLTPEEKSAVEQTTSAQESIPIPELVVEEKQSPDIQTLPNTRNDTEEIQKLKNLITQFTDELQQSNKERDELAVMWKNERTEKLQLEEEYYRIEAELNHMRFVHSQIGELLKIGNSYDPTASASIKLDTSKTITSLSIHSTSATPGDVTSSSNTTPHKPNISFGTPTYVPYLTNHSPRNAPTPGRMRNIPAHLTRRSMQIVAGSLMEEIQNEILKFDGVDATEQQEQEKSLTEKLQQQEQEEFAREIAKHQHHHHQPPADEAAEMNDIFLDFNAEEPTPQPKKSSTPPKDATMKSTSDMNTEISDYVDGFTDNESDETFSETEYDEDTFSQGSGDRAITPTPTGARDDGENDRRRSQSLSHPPRSSPSLKNKKLELKAPMKNALNKQVSSSNLTPNQSQSTNTPPGNGPGRNLNEMFSDNLSPAFILMEGIRRFNKTEGKPQQGIHYLQAHYLLPEGPLDDDNVVKAVARFIALCDNLSKAQVGLMLGNQKHRKILKEYANYMTVNMYKDQKFDFALRHFLMLFKLPLEGQQVMLICEEFAEAWVRHNPNGPLKDPTHTFLLVCTLLMVNQEQHNPKATTKMSRQQFLDIFKQTDISGPFLTDLYDSIKKKAMILLEDEDEQDDEMFAQPDDEDSEVLINDETIEQYMLMENCRRRPSITSIEEMDNGNRAVRGNQPITFLYKTKIMLRNRLRRFIIKDSDPVLSLVERKEANHVTYILERNPFLDREIARGHFFIVAYSVSDVNSFRAAQCIIDRILEMKRSNDVNQNKKKTKKNNTLTKTLSITDMINEELEDSEDDNKNDELIILVACKSEHAQRQVTYRQGVDYALQKAVAFYEVSSFQNSKQKIRGLFMTAFENILKAERIKRDDIKNKDKILVSKSLNIEELLNLPLCYID